MRPTVPVGSDARHPDGRRSSNPQSTVLPAAVSCADDPGRVRTFGDRRLRVADLHQQTRRPSTACAGGADRQAPRRHVGHRDLLRAGRHVHVDRGVRSDLAADRRVGPGDLPGRRSWRSVPATATRGGAPLSRRARSVPPRRRALPGRAPTTVSGSTATKIVTSDPRSSSVFFFGSWSTTVPGSVSSGSTSRFLTTGSSPSVGERGLRRRPGSCPPRRARRPGCCRRCRW